MDEVILTCDTHNKMLTEALFDYYKKEEMFDATVCFEDGKIRAHKLILSALSPKLAHVFKIDEETRHVYFTSISKSSMEYLIEYIYRGKVSVPSEALASVIEAAEYFQIKGFMSQNNGIENKVLKGVENLPVMEVEK
ncbi:longitudinals lacking protein, isoforms H/M/V-like [Leptinotarsa decemlineata]|uniref:longitudinals lacking protein, isoforms H/M/V-like n=1 Tax=Leptinotarsa decemlineata TaxID=7539 RepID=UPI000C2527C4|nr:longitudinals lacking protein, isoforms H/M/V-like [Leptinotarsa decemlineata]